MYQDDDFMLDDDLYYDSDDDSGEVEIDTEGMFAGLPMTPKQKQLVLNAQKVLIETKGADYVEQLLQDPPSSAPIPPSNVFHIGSTNHTSSSSSSSANNNSSSSTNNKKKNKKKKAKNQTKSK